MGRRRCCVVVLGPISSRLTLICRRIDGRARSHDLLKELISWLMGRSVLPRQELSEQKLVSKRLGTTIGLGFKENSQFKGHSSRDSRAEVLATDRLHAS